MRELTIKRHKSFVGCAAKIHVYVEDSVANELTINGVACRSLGSIKNGEEKTFSITDEQVKIFVIYDKLSKDTYNEVVTVPAGILPVTLSGKPHFNPMAGNPFRFDGVASEETLVNRKKGSKLGTVVLIVAIVVGFVVGYLLAPTLMGN